MKGLMEATGRLNNEVAEAEAGVVLDGGAAFGIAGGVGGVVLSGRKKLTGEGICVMLAARLGVRPC